MPRVPAVSVRHGVIMGMMGAGKTTVGRLVADRLGWVYRDSDDDIEARTGMTGGAFAAEYGVAALHDLEEQVLLEALARLTPGIIGASGWTVESERCRQVLADRALVVWLALPTPELVRRMTTGEHRRHIDPDEFEALCSRREHAFRSVADLRLDARRPPGELADEARELLTAPATESGP